MDRQISSFFTRAIQFCILPLYLDVSDEICHYFAIDIFPVGLPLLRGAIVGATNNK